MTKSKINFNLIPFLLILVIGLVLFKIYFLNINDNNFYWDETVYLQLAKDISNTGKYTSQIGETFRAPLIPYIFSMFSSLLSLRIFLTLIFFLSMFIYFKFLRLIFSREISMLGVIILFSNYLILFWSFKLLTEIISILFISASLYVITKYNFKNNIYLYALAIISGLLVLTRYPGLFLISSIFIHFLYYEKNNLFTQKKYYIFGFLFLLSLIPIFYLGIQNYGNPFGMLLANAAETNKNPTSKLFYLSSILKHFSLLILMSIISIILYKKEKTITLPNKIFLFSLMSVTTYFMLMTFFVAQKTDRFMILSIPFLVYLSLYLINYLKQNKINKLYYTLIALLVILSIANVGFTYKKLSIDKHSTTHVIKSFKFLSTLEGDGVATRMMPFSVYFANKTPFEVYAPNYLDSLITNGSITYIRLDDLDSKEFKDYVMSNYQQIYVDEETWDKIYIYKINTSN